MSIAPEMDELSRRRAKARERLALAGIRESEAEAQFRDDPGFLPELLAAKAEVEEALAEFEIASGAYLEALRQGRAH
jgi:hypothetical protein